LDKERKAIQPAFDIQGYNRTTFYGKKLWDMGQYSEYDLLTLDVL
jgi:hypothetical protein